MWYGMEIISNVGSFSNEVHRARLSLAEHLRRKLPREAADGMLEPGGLSQSGRSPIGGRALALSIQPGSSPQQSGFSHASRILGAMESEPTREESTPSASGDPQFIRLN